MHANETIADAYNIGFKAQRYVINHPASFCNEKRRLSSTYTFLCIRAIFFGGESVAVAAADAIFSTHSPAVDLDIVALNESGQSFENRLIHEYIGLRKMPVLMCMTSSYS